MRRKVFWVIVIVVVGVGFAFQTMSEKYFDIAKSLDIFATLFKEVNTHYVDEVEPEQLINVGIEGMLESLDPYTQYIPEDESETFNVATTGQYAGVGTLIGSIRKKVVITEPYPNFPAALAGLKVGDEIISIDNHNVNGLSLQEVSNLLKGRARTEVKVTVHRPGSKTDQSFSITRQHIKISNLAYYGILEKKIGYIRLDDFTMGAGREVRQAVAELMEKGATQIILDVRQNPGGLMFEAINVVSAFIPKGKPVVTTKGKMKEWNHTYKTLDDPIDKEIPLVVLIDGESASASEIVAGALQDYDRAVLIGNKTFGKGLVQTTRKLSYGAQLKITTAKYYIPSGRCIQELDYQHRKVDGTAMKYSDSIRAEFFTGKGRKVYDGHGLDPDMPIVPTYLGQVATELANQGFIFEYASLYVSKHSEPDSFSSFSITEEDYNDFVSWVKEQNFHYKTGMEVSTDELLEASKEEKNFNELKPFVNSLKQKIESDKFDDLVRFKMEIIQLLNQQIAFHYNQHQGSIEYAIHKDPALQKAMHLLSSPSLYHQTLDSATK